MQRRLYDCCPFTCKGLFLLYGAYTASAPVTP